MTLLECLGHADDAFDIADDSSDEEVNRVIKDAKSSVTAGSDGSGIDLLYEKLTAKKQAKAGGAVDAERTIDPAMIIAIINAIIGMIGNCNKPTPTLVRRRLGNRVKLALAIHTELSRLQ